MLALAAIGIAVIIAVGGSSHYILKLQMRNASGVRPGSQVLLGGVSVGTVDSLDVDRARNEVVAKLKLNKHDVHVGQGAQAAVVAANLLGEKYVALQPGDRSRPLPSGSLLPRSATKIPTDLDQIVAVLDRSTRTRLAILLREAGIAVAGRRADVNAILRQFPLSVTAATRLLQTMVRDNHTLADLVVSSNGFLARMNRQRPDLQRVIEASAGAATTFARRSESLRQAVIRGGPALHAFHDWFAKGQAAVRALEPSVPRIRDALPQLDRLLRAARPFTRDAVPTLNRAAAVSPVLSRLAVKATPTLHQAVPTFAALEQLAGRAVPFSPWAGLSSEDLFNIFAGWTRAIQFRDGLSHVFNGDLYLPPRVIMNMANQGATPAQRRRNLLNVKNEGLLQAMGLLDRVRALRLGGRRDRKPTQEISGLLDHVAPPAAPPPGKGEPHLNALLDYLLGR